MGYKFVCVYTIVARIQQSKCHSNHLANLVAIDIRRSEEMEKCCLERQSKGKRRQMARPCELTPNASTALYQNSFRNAFEIHNNRISLFACIDYTFLSL